jgi:hypothetical protein
MTESAVNFAILAELYFVPRPQPQAVQFRGLEIHSPGNVVGNRGKMQRSQSVRHDSSSHRRPHGLHRLN